MLVTKKISIHRKVTSNSETKNGERNEKRSHKLRSINYSDKKEKDRNYFRIKGYSNPRSLLIQRRNSFTENSVEKVKEESKKVKEGRKTVILQKPISDFYFSDDHPIYSIKRESLILLSMRRNVQHCSESSVIFIEFEGIIGWPTNRKFFEDNSQAKGFEIIKGKISMMIDLCKAYRVSIIFTKASVSKSREILAYLETSGIMFDSSYCRINDDNRHFSMNSVL